MNKNNFFTLTFIFLSAFLIIIGQNQHNPLIEMLGSISSLMFIGIFIFDNRKQLFSRKKRKADHFENIAPHPGAFEFQELPKKTEAFDISSIKNETSGSEKFEDKPKDERSKVDFQLDNYFTRKKAKLYDPKRKSN